MLFGLGDEESIGVLGYESIRKRLKGLNDIGIDLSAKEILSLKPKERPPQLNIARGLGYIIVDPPYTDKERDKLLGNVSLDLELGDTLRIHGNPHTHPVERDGSLEDPIVDITIPETIELVEKNDTLFKLRKDQCYVLAPGALVKAFTLRYFFMPYNLMGMVSGRSKLGRFGITTTVDAPKIDPGFSGRIVLELAHLGRYRFALRVGMQVSQMMFLTVEGKIGKPYDEIHPGHERQEGIKYMVPPMSLFPNKTIERRGIIPINKQEEDSS